MHDAHRNRKPGALLAHGDASTVTSHTEERGQCRWHSATSGPVVLAPSSCLLAYDRNTRLRLLPCALRSCGSMWKSAVPLQDVQDLTAVPLATAWPLPPRPRSPVLAE